MAKMLVVSLKKEFLGGEHFGIWISGNPLKNIHEKRPEWMPLKDMVVTFFEKVSIGFGVYIPWDPVTFTEKHPETEEEYFKRIKDIQAIFSERMLPVPEHWSLAEENWSKLAEEFNSLLQEIEEKFGVFHLKNCVIGSDGEPVIPAGKTDFDAWYRSWLAKKVYQANAEMAVAG